MNNVWKYILTIGGTMVSVFWTAKKASDYKEKKRREELLKKEKARNSKI